MIITERRISLALPKQLMRKVNQVAKRKRLTRSALVRLALTELLEAESRTGQAKQQRQKRDK